jgi:purine-nucleoside phosphorylase
LADKIGIILGSGLNEFVKELTFPEKLFEENESFHKLSVVSGKILKKEVLLFSGRKHFYEGYDNNSVFSNVNFAKEFGVTLLIITNAAGGINSVFRISDLMLITSHFNFIKKKFIDENNSSFYNKNIQNKIKNYSLKEKIVLRSGSYCCNPGPMYETKSEIKFLKKVGVDAVGMSTVPEIILANNFGIRTIAISCITNLLKENESGKTDHEEVIVAGKNAYKKFSGLLKLIISKSSELT